MPILAAIAAAAAGFVAGWLLKRCNHKAPLAPSVSPPDERHTLPVQDPDVALAVVSSARLGTAVSSPPWPVSMAGPIHQAPAASGEYPVPVE